MDYDTQVALAPTEEDKAWLRGHEAATKRWSRFLGLVYVLGFVLGAVLGSLVCARVHP